MRQSAAHRCDCGAKVPVAPMTAYEFTWRCRCGRAGVISHAHAADPPMFQPAQSTLFDSLVVASRRGPGVRTGSEAIRCK